MSTILLLAAISGLFQPSTVTSKDASDLKDLYRLEEVWNTAHVKGDADALDKLWASDLIVTIAAMPVMKKADALAMVKSNRMPFTKYETSELTVKRFGESALVTGRLQRERSINGKQMSDDWRFTKVYVMSQGRWQVIAWHASPSNPK
jgi:ketosteroid isomerase-like protein